MEITHYFFFLKKLYKMNKFLFFFSVIGFKYLSLILNF